MCCKGSCKLPNCEGIKTTQGFYFDQKGLSDFEITRPHGTGKLYEFLIAYKMRAMARMVGASFSGQKLNIKPWPPPSGPRIYIAVRPSGEVKRRLV